MIRSIQLTVWICFVISIGSQRAIWKISCLKQLNCIVRISIIFANWFNQLTVKGLPVGRSVNSTGDWQQIHRPVMSKEWRNP